MFVDLRLDKLWVGRDKPPQDVIATYDSFVFTSQHIDEKNFERLSKHHFDIERVTSSNACKEICPAVLVCYGRNGIFVNDEKVTMHERRMLNDGDLIKLGKVKVLFKFYYANIPQTVQSMPKNLLSKYFVGREIGSGGCGVVRLVYNLKTTEMFAMKIIKKEMNTMVKNRDDINAKIINEVNIMRKINHVHVLGLIDSFETYSNVIIVMSYLQGRDLLYRITQHNPKQRYLNEKDAKFMFMQICMGLKYLHDEKITHRDIKPDNILLVDNNDDPIVKISDFGLSKIIAQADMMTVCGTQLYVAPEIMKNRGAYTNKVDIWSMGCLLYAMLSGAVPFSDAYAPPDLITQIKNAKYSFDSAVWKKVSLSAKNLISKMLQKDPKKRLSIDEILSHEWFKCAMTRRRLETVYRRNSISTESLLDDSLENTMLNVNEKLADVSIKEPPQKKRRIF